MIYVILNPNHLLKNLINLGNIIIIKKTLLKEAFNNEEKLLEPS